MNTETTHGNEYTSFQAYLYMAIELSLSEWKLGFSIGFGQEPRLRTIKARNLAALKDEISAAKKRISLPEDAPVLSCYEAGRDGMWIHRYLLSIGVENLVIDSSSIEVNRKAKRAKTDKLDVKKMLMMLMRYQLGEEKVWSVVQVPSLETEDHRHLHRELDTLKAERTRHINRIKGLLIGQGIGISIQADFLEQLNTIRLWDGAPLPAGLQRRLRYEYQGLQFVEEQIETLEAERLDIVRHSTRADVEMVRQLMRLKGIGVASAWVFVMEFFAWRCFRNRREVGSLAGLTPTPYQSGDSSREQGISKEGNTLVRSMAIQIAWGWLQHQPESKLSRWYQERYGKGSSSLRKIGIVALARRMLVDLWRYLETGWIPEGAELKTHLL
jgi:transposase